jgi:outer membrane protein assembly complex protein YaeT
VVCLLAGQFSVRAGDPAACYGKRVERVLFEPAAQPLTRDQLGLIFSIRPGDTLEELALSQAIERLWATGRYADIVVEAEPVDAAVQLTVRTVSTFFVGRVTVEGVPDPPNATQLINTTRYNLGEPYDESQLPEAVESLMAVLRANGFYHAQVARETLPRPRTEEMDIRFIVTPGRRARLTTPSFTGDVKLPLKKLVRATKYQKWKGVRGWKDLNAQLLQQGIERIRTAYLKADYLRADVRIADLKFDPEKLTVQPRFEIDAGPRVLVRTEGAKLSTRNTRALAPVYQERTVDRELLVEGQRNIEQHFRNQGFFDTTVSYTMTGPTDAGEQTIRYSISRGPRYRLVYLEVEGNEYFTDQTVRERMGMIPARSPRYRRGVFSRILMDQDRAAILELYHSNGFRDAVVKTRLERGWKGKPTDIAVFFQIEEGKQWFVSEVEMTGVDLRYVEMMQTFLTSAPGQPFAIATVASDRDTVLNWYFNNGYPDATFDAEVKPAGDGRQMALKYTVREGRRNFVREVLISGLKTTRRDLVTSRLLVAPGDPLSQSSIVETQRRLYDLGIFAKVDVAVQNPEGRERNRYVLLQAEEAKRYSLNFGVGAQLGRIGGGANSFDAPAGTTGFSSRFQVGLTRSNMFGLAHTASATARISNIQQRLLASYQAPQFRGNSNVNLTFSTLVDHSQDVRTYTSTRTESAVQVGQKVSRSLSLQYRTTARFVFIDEDSLKIDPALIPIYSQPVKTIGVSGTIIQDLRDDPIDSHRGIYSTLDLGFAPAISKSSTNYTRLVARNSTYHPIRADVTFARSTSFGYLRDLDEDPVPLPENFFAGGATTHRGFPDNQAGPRDLVTGFPLGGQSFLFFQHEIRFPLIGRSVGGVLFHDMGNVFQDLDSLSFRFKQRDRQDFAYTVQAMGIGFRFKTPVGPLRIDFSYSPNAPKFVGFEGSRDDLINGTGKYDVPLQVRKFQFHFSIGQTF